MTIPPTHALYSYDLVNMFTNIPQDDAIRLAGIHLKDDTTLKERTPIRPDDLIKLLEHDVKLAYFQFRGKFYSQPRGLGMGKSTSSPLSDIYMEDFETRALSSFSTADAILFWLRKADNTLICIHKDHADNLFTHSIQTLGGPKRRRSMAASACWTSPSNKTTTALSLLMSIGSLHTNQYIHFSSHLNTNSPQSVP